MSLLRKPERRGATLKSILIMTAHWIRATVTISSPTDRVTKLIISYNVQCYDYNQIRANNGQSNQANYFLQQTEYYDYNRPNKSKQRTE